MGLRQLRHWVTRHAAIPDFSDAESSALRKIVQEEGRLSGGYVLMSALSAGIATLGLLQSSAAVVIGAMLISPLMNPIAALGFGFASLDGHRIRDAAKVVVLGAAIGVTTGLLLTWISPIRNATPEIISRTQPTLLDLAVALLSGLAGGYATVRQKGGTAIGVAIATALMPPLATVGYSLAVANWEFAGGAFLLFVTNLAAIAFSFAFIARLSSVARPLSHVELTPGYITIGVIAFAVLATPLGLTLIRVSKEARARSTARAVLMQELNVEAGKIAQLDVKWPLFGTPSIDAVVIERSYLVDAQRRINARIASMLNASPDISLQQIVAADDGAQTRAMIDAAVERNAAGIAKDAPALDAIRATLDVPTQSLWIDRGTRTVYVVPIDVPDWELAEYFSLEQSLSDGVGGWGIRVVPPITRRLFVAYPATVSVADATTRGEQQLALWALKRWAVGRVVIETQIDKPGNTSTTLASARLASLLGFFRTNALAVDTISRVVKGRPDERLEIRPAPLLPAEKSAARN
ncbi:MAG: DUF389 domain-containing protein [Gemmatimonas sp.]